MAEILLPPMADAGPNGYSGGVSGLHYTKVSENPHDGNTTTLTMLLNQSESYSIDVSPIPDEAIINSLRVQMAVGGTTAGPSTSKVGVRIGGIDYFGVDHTLEASLDFNVFNDIFATNPATAGLAWLKSVVASLILRHVVVTQLSDLPRPKLTQLVAFADITVPVSIHTNFTPLAVPTTQFTKLPLG